MNRPERVPRPRGVRHYDKPALEPTALLDRFVARGMSIADRDRALRYLRHIGYYRLSPYAIPFQRSHSDQLMREGPSFDDVLDLYVFDRALRLLVIDALERVEVAVRAALTDHMATTYEDPHWYADASHFSDARQHHGLVRIVRATSESRLLAVAEPARTENAGSATITHRSALEHYLTTYGRPELPPSWVMVEGLTIGQLASAYRNLMRRSDRTAVAASLGVTGPVLESWMQTYVRVRNVCAHHGRLWNLGLGVYPMIPTSRSIAWLRASDSLPERSQKRLYPVLVSLQSILSTVSPGSGWAVRLHELMETRPLMNLAGMGMPSDWSRDEFWRRRLE